MVPTTYFRQEVGQIVSDAGGRAAHPGDFTFRGEAFWRFVTSPALQKLLSTPRCPLCETELHDEVEVCSDLSLQEATVMRCGACGWSQLK